MAGGAVVLAAASVAAGVVVSGGEDATSAARERAPATAPVERGPLASMVAVNGTLTYRARADGSSYSVVNRARGTYTRLPSEGRRVDCGDVLYRVDDEPVLALCGPVPAYRDLEIGDEGNDVRQLNRSLRRLGFATDPRDRDFTWRTAAALRRLQRDRGADVTGKLGDDEAIFLPRPLRIARLTGRLGGAARPGAQVAEATSGTLEVQVELDPSQQGEVRRGDRARITLPGNRSVRGRVDRLGRVARTLAEDDDVAAATIPAYVRLDRPARARGLDRAPVRVEITTEGVKSALSVPVVALVGKAGGGFAVEVVRAGGRRELVAVQPGLFDTAAGRVEVDGRLGEGDRVVVPSL